MRGKCENKAAQPCCTADASAVAAALSSIQSRLKQLRACKPNCAHSQQAQVLGFGLLAALSVFVQAHASMPQWHVVSFE